MCDFSHLKKKKNPLHSSHHISFAFLSYKIPGKNCRYTFYFQFFFCLNLLQSGFYVHCFRKTALVKVTDDLHVAKSSCQFSALILLGLSAAFDTADNSLFLHELSSFGFWDVTVSCLPPTC